MPWTKRQIIKQAYEELGLAGYEFDISSEEMQTGLRLLDLCLAEWNVQGVRIGYSGGNGYGEIDAESTVPDWAVNGLYLSLAVRIAPSLGKTPSTETKSALKEARNSIGIKTQQPRPVQPTGYGGQAWRYPRIRDTRQDLQTGPDGALEFGNAHGTDQ